MKLGWMLMVAVVMQAIVAYGASFDCRKAVLPREKAICADATLGKLDEQMSAAYFQELRGVSEAAGSLMRDDQRLWLRWLGIVCDAAKPGDPQKLAACLEGPYRARAEELQKMTTRRGSVLFYSRAVYLAAPVKDAVSAGATAEFPGFGTVTARWVQADSHDPEWVAWNAAMALWAREMFDGKDGPWTPALVEGADESIFTAVEQLTPALISVYLQDDSMGHGAAHPNSSWKHIHWLRTARREMQPGDVFQDGSDWKKALSERCWTNLQQKLGARGLLIKGPTAKELVAVTGSPRDWTFESGGLTISFPEYSVSPRAFPAPDVTVPWSVLRPYLAANSPVGR
ncbi:MAG: DUF3298 domain-containing protein [Granulicella sp.]